LFTDSRGDTLQLAATLMTARSQAFAETPDGISLDLPARPEPLPARVKVLNPMTSLGPPMHAELISSFDGGIEVRVPRRILVGSVVQVRTGERIVFGEVRSCEAAGAQFEIAVRVVVMHQLARSEVPV
jgi:hypothetical protein